MYKAARPQSSGLFPGTVAQESHQRSFLYVFICTCHSFCKILMHCEYNMYCMQHINRVHIENLTTEISV